MVNPTTPPVPTAISGLTTIPSTPGGSDFIPISRGGITYKAAANQLGGTGPTGPQGPPGTVVPWCVAGGSADAITGAFTPAVTSLTDGLLLNFRATAANATTTPTFKADATTAHTITDLGGGALVANAIPAQYAEMSIRYNLANTRWELMNPANTITGVTTTGSPSSGNLAKFSGGSSITNTDLTGDVTTSGGSATTLATVNSNTGSFVAASITVNGKGQITAASNSGIVSGALTLLSTQTISSSTASVSVTAGINSTYSHYIWEISNLVSVAGNADAYITVQQGGVFIGGTSYLLNGLSSNGGTVTAYNNGTGGARFIVSNGTNQLSSGGPSIIKFEFWNPSIASPLNIISTMFAYANGGTQAQYIADSGLVATSAATTGIKLGMSSGNIASCLANLYGIT